MKGFYEGINRFMRAHKNITGVAEALDKMITLAMLFFYPLFLVWLAAVGDDLRVFVQCIIIPAVGFIVLSVFRRMYNAGRPYEIYEEIIALNGKSTSGSSFPSRHVFSIFMIAETYLYVMDDISAAIFYILGIVLMLTRVSLGCHFIKDVLSGAFFALVCGVFFYM